MDGVKIGLGICCDLFYSEMATLYRKFGMYRIYIRPFCTPQLIKSQVQNSARNFQFQYEFNVKYESIDFNLRYY